MSYVNNAVLSAHYLDSSTRDALAERGWTDIGKHAGGPKVFEADTYGKAFSHTMVDEIKAEVTECLGHVSGCVLVIHLQGDNEFEGNDEVHVWHISAWDQPPRFTPLHGYDLEQRE